MRGKKKGKKKYKRCKAVVLISFIISIKYTREAERQRERAIYQRGGEEVYVHGCVCVYVCVCAFMCVCVRLCVCVCAFMCV
jgi:hypothetical protein